MMFFFFQAEDGIRYLTVTGVQTCALPICAPCGEIPHVHRRERLARQALILGRLPLPQRQVWVAADQHRLQRGGDEGDRKSTRLNSSHSQISYAVFCLKKMNREIPATRMPTA